MAGKYWWIKDRNEFHWLCKKIIHDGRDPYIVAEAMFERLVLVKRDYKELWGAAHDDIT